MKTRLQILVAVCFCALALSAQAGDWPQWRGPERNDVSRETGLLKNWPKNGPRLLWTYSDAGVGYPGPAVVGDRFYAMGARRGTEDSLAIDVHTAPPICGSRGGP